MKKNILFILPLLLVLLFPFTSVDAITKINFKQTSNGNIETTMHFDEGFVGGIEFKVQLSDAVSVKDFAFNKNYETSNFTRRFSYNSTTHILTVRVTSGGIGANHNLLNKNRELTLGTIKLATDAKTSVDYTLSSPTLSYIDNSWKLEPIANTNLTLGDTTKFTYVVNTSTKPSEEEKDPEPSEDKNEPSEDKTGSETSSPETKPSDDNKTEDNKETTTPNDNTNNNSNSNATSSSSSNSNNSTNTNTSDRSETSNKTPATSNSKEDTKEDELEENKELEDETADNSASYTTPNTSNKETTSEEKETKVSKVVIIISVIAIILVALLIIFAVLKNRDKKKIDF